MNQTKLLSLGTMYIDINCTNFPFDKALFANRETTGNTYDLELGGSALNFAKNATMLGLKTTVIGKVGDDLMGEQLLRLLKKAKIDPAVLIDPHAQTNLAIHYIHQDGTSIMTSSGNANQSLTQENIKTMLEMNTQNSNYLYLGGCFKLKHLQPYLPKIAQLIKKKEINIILDHGRVNNNVTKEDISQIHKLLPYIDIYLPSIDEFFAVWDAQTIDGGYEKVNKISQALVVVKQGDLGAIGFEDGRKIVIPAFPVKAVNTVGAGDSFNAGFIKAYSEKKSFEACIRFACATAAVKISQKKVTREAINALV